MKRENITNQSVLNPPSPESTAMMIESLFPPEGEIDITNRPVDEVLEYVTNEIKGKIISTHLPIIICYKHFRKKASEAGSKIFDNFSDMLYFVSKHKRIFIYQAIHNKISNKYNLRYFDENLNFFDYWLTRIRFKKFFKTVKN